MEINRAELIEKFSSLQALYDNEPGERMKARIRVLAT